MAEFFQNMLWKRRHFGDNRGACLCKYCAQWSNLVPLRNLIAHVAWNADRELPIQTTSSDWTWPKAKKLNKNIMRQHSLTGIPPTRCSCVCWCSMPARKSCLKHINWINYSQQVMKCQDRFPLNLYAQSKPTVIHHDGINNPQIYAVTKTWVKNKGWMFALFLILFSHLSHHWHNATNWAENGDDCG